jgi:hypothetical protein
MTLTRLALIALCAIIYCLPGCAPIQATDVPPPDYSLRTPRLTTEYLQWAVDNESSSHTYNCLSKRFRDVNEIKLSELDFFWDTAKSRLLEYVGGSLDNVEIEDEEILDTNTRLVTYVSGEYRAVVRFVREIEWDVEYRSARIPGDGGQVAALEDLIRVEGGRAFVELPLENDSVDADDVYQLRVRAQWRIDNVEENNLEEIRNAEESPQP